MTITSNLMGGFQTAFYICVVLSVAGIGTSYLLPNGATLNEYIETRSGLDTNSPAVI